MRGQFVYIALLCAIYSPLAFGRNLKDANELSLKPSYVNYLTVSGVKDPKMEDQICFLPLKSLALPESSTSSTPSNCVQLASVSGQHYTQTGDAVIV